MWTVVNTSSRYFWETILSFSEIACRVGSQTENCTFELPFVGLKSKLCFKISFWKEIMCLVGTHRKPGKFICIGVLDEGGKDNCLLQYYKISALLSNE